MMARRDRRPVPVGRVGVLQHRPRAGRGTHVGWRRRGRPVRPPAATYRALTFGRCATGDRGDSIAYGRWRRRPCRQAGQV